jgi:hypothetical protein
MVMAICAVLGLIVYRHVFGWHVLNGPVLFEFDQLTRKNNLNMNGIGTKNFWVERLK